MEFQKIPKELAEKLKQAQKDDNLTRSPDVNNIIRVVQMLKEGKGKAEQLQEQLNILYNLHKNMITAFEFLSKTQPVTKVSEERLPMIMEALEGFKEALEEINLYLEDNKINHLDKGIEILIDETDALFESTDILKKDEEKIETYSDSPLISELIRIGKGVAEGLYEPETLKKRLELCKNFHRVSVENFKEIMNEPFDTKEAEQEAPLIIDALDLMEEGLDEIEMYFETNQPENILEGIELVRQAAEELSNSYKVLKVAVEEADKEIEKKTNVLKEKVCFKCGLRLQPQVKICPKCHIPIPDIKQEEDEGPTVTVDFAETRETDTVAPMMTPNVKKIYDTAVGFIQKKVSKEEFISTLDWLDNILRQSEESLKKEKLPELSDEREREIMEQTKLLFEMGIKESKEGVTEMRLYIEDENPVHLQNGILQAIKGGEKLYQVQMLAKRIQQEAKELKEKKN